MTTTNTNIENDITRVFQEEGPSTGTTGNLTVYGISQRNNPEMFTNGPPTEAQARVFYAAKYVVAPGFNNITDINLQAQLIDFGINSGPAIAIQKLQAILKVEVDGILGPLTLAAISAVDPKWLNNQLVGARCLMFANLALNSAANVQFIVGWITRAISYLD